MLQNKQLKIIFISGLLSGGSEKVTSEIINYLDENKLATVTLGCPVASETFYTYSNNVNIFQSKKLISWNGKVFTMLNLFYSFLQLLNFCKKTSPDLIVGFITMNNLFAIFLSKFTRIPVIISCRNNPQKVKLPWHLKKLRKVYYKDANLIVLQTDSTKTLFDQLKIELPKYKVIKNLIDAKYFASQKSVLKEKFILNVGSLTPQKNQSHLIEIFAKTIAPDWRLIIVGEGPLRSNLEKQILSLKLKGRVILLGKQKQVEKLYSSASIFAFTSVFEGYPNALAEAMLSGVPSISYNCETGPSEIIKDEINGFLVKQSDDVEYLRKLQLLIDNKDLRTKFSQSSTALKLILDREIVQSEWVETFHEISNEI